MLTGSAVDDWRLINYRRVSTLLAAEFLHDLYNQCNLELNPVRFRNTICVLEVGMFRAFAPKREWDLLAQRLGHRITEDADLRARFARFLRKPQHSLKSLLSTLDKSVKNGCGEDPVELVTKISLLQYSALKQIYEINLVQFEHAIEHALIGRLGSDRVGDAVGAVATSAATMGVKEQLVATELSLDVSTGLVTAEVAKAEYDEIFGSLRYAYGAEEDQCVVHRIDSLLTVPAEQRKRHLAQLSRRKASRVTEHSDPLVREIGNLGAALGRRRDRNKRLMGKVSWTRSQLLSALAQLTGESLHHLRRYLLSELFELADVGKHLSTDALRERAGRLVFQREECLLYGADAVDRSVKVGALLLTPPDPLIRGQVASPGETSGRVRKVYSATEAESVLEDEIMVAFGTDFDVISGMQKCVGIITEEGGLLSHASVVARELCKPCIIGATHAMNHLNDGDVISMGSPPGTVQIERRAKESPLLLPGPSSAITDLSSPHALVGQKARNLARVAKLGLAVIPGYEIRVIKKEKIRSLARAVIERAKSEEWSQTIIVRSNAECEDGEDASFAGAFDTRVCEAVEQSLAHNILLVLQSYESVLGEKGASHTVLVQPMYRQKLGGVAFSHDPVSGRRKLTLEASRDGAARITKGLSGQQAAIEDGMRRAIGKQVSVIEREFGRPVNVEWGWGDEGLKIFQARLVVNYAKFAS